MKIAFNPSTVASLTTPPNNKDITFDLRGQNIFARGVKFYGTDTNTWRDIKINNVSIGSYTLDLRNGSNTTLTNTNGVVTINSTWRPVVDNLTSDSTTSSLSAKQGKVLKALIDGKSNSDHNHDGRYVYNYGGTAANGQTLNQNALFMSTTSDITGDQWHILQAAWNGEYRWNSQIAFPTQNRNGMYYRSGLDDNTKWGSWVKLLDTNNYSSTLDSRYYTESEVNSLLDAKLNRQNLSYGTWNPRGYSLAADYQYNGGDLSISENSGQIHVSIDGYFWQNEGRYRVLDTSDIGDIRDSVTLHQFLSAADAAWYPLVWGGNAHNNTSDSTGAVYKSYDKLSWQTSSQTLYATNIQTNNIKNLSIGGGIYWNPYVEYASDNTDAASITLVRSGVAGGTTLVLSQMNDANDTIQFKTNTAARLYHNNYPILTTQNTYVSNNKGYINGSEITQVNNSDTLDNWHKDEINRTLYITSGTSGLSSYWAKLWEINLNDQYNDVTITFLAAASYYPSYFSIFSVYLRQNGSDTSKDIYARLVELIGNIAVGDTELRLYVNNTTGNCQLWGNVKSQYGTMNLSVLKKAWRTATDSSNIGTFFSTSFDNVQSLPGDGWYKVGVIQQDVVGAFNPATHTHTVFKNNLMIKGTNGISDSASIHLGIGDSDTGFKWISDGVCQIYANNAAVGQWTSGGMNWFENPTVNGNKVWNAGNDGSGSGLDADMVDGYHATDGRTFNGDIHWGSWHDTWSDGTHTHPWYGFDHRYPNTGAYSTTISDYYGMTIKTYNTLLLDCGTLLLNSRNNVGIGTTSPTQKLDVAGNIRATGQIIREGYSQMWVNGRNGALLRETSAVGYHTLWSLKTTDGSWDFGEYHINSDWNNIPVLSYVTDSNYNSGNNATTYQIKFPLASGTVALTSNIPNPTNYYWANVKISTSSSTTTSPTVSNLTATNSIRMGNILLENTDEINNSANGNIYLNYRYSGNVILCQGGGNVGIGAMSPSYKLNVNGQIRASGFHHDSHNDDSYILLAGGGTSHIKHGSTYWSTAIQFGNYVWLMLQIGEASNGISVVPTNISNPTKDIYVMNAQLGSYRNSRHGRYRVAPNGVLYYVDGVDGMQIYTTICYVVNS